MEESNKWTSMDEYRTSKTLLMQLQEGSDDKSWERFTSEYRPFIYSLIKGCGVKHEDTEELVQDVLVKVWKAMSDFLYTPERCRFRTWLARVTKNSTINFLDLKRNKQKKLEVNDSADILKNISADNEVDENAEKEWRLFVAQRAWENIKVNFSENVLKAYTLMAAGRSSKEVAAELSLEENSIYTYRRRVKEALSREIRRLNVELDG